MKIKKASFAHRALSLILSALIIVLSPGLPCYSVFAENLNSSTSGEGAINLSGAGQGAPQISDQDMAPLREGAESAIPAGADIGLGGADIVPEASDSQSQGDGKAEPAADKNAARPAESKGQAPSLRNQLVTGGAELVRADEGSKPRLLSRLFGENSKLSSFKNLIFGGGRTSSHLSGLQKAAYLGDEAVLNQKIVDTPIVVMDYETSSFIAVAEASRPIELGVVAMKLKEDGQAHFLNGKGFDELINPAGLPLDERVTELTGIIPGDLKGRRGLDQVLARLKETVPSNAILLAHSATFEGTQTGYWAKQLGIKAPENMLLDTQEIARKVFPGLKSYRMRDLIQALNIGDVESHRGDSDSMQEGMLFTKEIEKIAKDKGVKISDLTVRDLVQYTPVIHFDTILDAMKPKAPAVQPPKPVSSDVQAVFQEFSKVQFDNHIKGLPNMLRDTAYTMGVEYEALRKALLEAAQLVKVSKADEILDAIAKRAEEAAKAGKQFMVVFDIDKTLTENGANGLSTGVPQEARDAFLGLLMRGVAIGVLTSRSYDSQPSDTTIPMAAKDVLFSWIPASLRSGVTFAGLAGGELVRFEHGSGNPIRDLKADWTDEEKGVIDSSIKAALAGMNLTEKDLTAFIHPRAQVDVVFKLDAQNPNNFAQAQAFAHKLNEEVRARNFPYQVIQGRNWVYINKYNKGAGIRNILISLRGQGQAVSEETMLYVADEFNDAPGRPAGGDVAAASGLPDANFINVGGLASEPLPANVQQITIKGPRAVVRIIAAINKGLDAAGRSTATPLLSRRPVQLALAALTGAALMLLAGHAALWAPVSAGAFLILGCPQIITNSGILKSPPMAKMIRFLGLPQSLANSPAKFEAVKDIPLNAFLIWFGVAGLLAASYVAIPAYFWSNFFNMIQAAVLIWQKNHWDPQSGAWMKAVLATAPVVAVLAASWFAPAAMAAIGLSKLVFPAAMGLLFIINVPQMNQNYQLYKETGKTPRGVNPAMPGLVLLGSVLQVMVALRGGPGLDLGARMSMTLNGGVSIAAVLVVLGQLFDSSARYANALVAPVFSRVKDKAPKKP